MNQCYFCGKEAVTKEHVPPKSMFPSHMRQDLIKVPSCKKHNNEKSGNDEYFRYLVMGQSKIVMSQKRFKTLLNNLLRSIKRKPALTVALLNTKKKIRIMDNGNIVENTIKVDEVRLNDSLEAISKGIYYFECNQIFNGITQIYALDVAFTDNNDREILYFENQKEVNRKILNNFKDAQFKGNNPIVFKYRNVIQEKSAFIHLRFYNEIDYVIGLYEA